MTDRPLRRALVSVSDKTGLIEFARALSARGVELLSTGGTAKSLRDANLSVTEVSAVTGFPEMMDGRVKTLHPKIHGGLLALRDDPAHATAMREHAIEGIDLLVCNLYPFEATVAKGAAFDDVIENIDIGGPAMIRSAAKNHEWVTVIVDPEDYAPLLAEIEQTNGNTCIETRRKFAQIAYARTAAYDAAVSNWFAGQIQAETPRRRSFAGNLRQGLRYGENPHQQAAFYAGGEKRLGVTTAHQLQGKELSYNNIADTDAAFELVAEFDAKANACVIVKHANPCGVALGSSLADAYRKALACDPLSAFGGIIAFNRVLDGETAEEVSKLFTEVIVAPNATDDAKRILSAKKNLRLLVTGGMPDPLAPGLTFRSVAGGFLVQTRDNGRVADADLKYVTKKKPTPAQMADLMFALTVTKHVKSNAVVYVKDLQTAGIGAGQMSRIDSARNAARKAEEAAKTAGWSEPMTRGSVAASEAFFPFTDSLLAVVEAGATAIIQPGGAMRDEDVIKAADDAGIAMVFTGMRHFKH